MSASGIIRLDSSALSPGRWTNAPFVPSVVLRCEADGHATLSRGGRVAQTWADPLSALQWMQAFLRDYAAYGIPDARWVGYLGYDLGRYFEHLPNIARDDLRLPLFAFAFANVPRDLPADLITPPDRALGAARPQSSFSSTDYQTAVGRVIDYIRAGDVFQVNLSQRFTAGLPAQPLQIYERLLERSPALFGGILDFGDHALISNSPELFLRVTPHPDGTRTVTTRPIKGTRPRSPGMDAELLHSIKDQAELNMIVDLERNDLGRVCEIGSVKVTQPRAIEEHPTVYHGAATVEGTLRPDVSFVDLLRATFPGGSITGAPKIRAMEIIEELEPTRRGPYCGAIGYLAADGHAEFNVAIRTMIIKDGLVHIPVGGGVVADSTPHAEYEETLVKARAMFRALGVSPDDLRTA